MIEFTDKLILTYVRGRHGGPESLQAVVSTDGGKSWRVLSPDSPFTDNVQTSGLYGFLREGTTLYVDVFPLGADYPDYLAKGGRQLGHYHDVMWVRTPPSWRVRRFSRQGELVETFTLKLQGLPWQESSYELYGTIVELPNGDLLAPFLSVVEPTRRGGEKGISASSVAIGRSKDGGKTFQHVWTFEPFVDGKKIGSTGCSEPDLAVLPNGDLLCIMRTGSDTPMYQARSRDGGRTWSKPFSTGWPGVKPRLRVLSNGVLGLQRRPRHLWPTSGHPRHVQHRRYR